MARQSATLRLVPECQLERKDPQTASEAAHTSLISMPIPETTLTPG